MSHTLVDQVARALAVALPASTVDDVMQTLAIGLRHRERQAEKARLTRKLSDTEIALLLDRYDAAGSKYGLVKRLAREFGISAPTVRKAIDTERERRRAIALLMQAAEATNSHHQASSICTTEQP